MLQAKSAHLLFVIVFIVGVVSVTHGQQATVMPEKRAAIKELLTVLESEKIAKSTFDQLLRQYHASLTQSTIKERSGQSDESLSPAELEKSNQIIREFYDGLFTKIQERVSQKFNMLDIIETIAIPVYDKYFTLDELKELTELFRTPIGKKFTALTPQIAGDINAKYAELFAPQIESIAKEVIDEHLKELQARFGGESEKRDAPPAKRPVRRQNRKQ